MTPEDRAALGSQLQAVHAEATGQPLQLRVIGSVIGPDGIGQPVASTPLTIVFTDVDDAVAFFEALEQWVPTWWHARQQEIF